MVPGFSAFSAFTLYSAVLLSSVPEVIFSRLSLPTNGSAMVLNTRAEKGWSSAHTRSTASPVFGLVPSSTRPAGEGIRSMMLSSSLAMPTRLTLEQHTTGTTVPSTMPWRRPCIISSGDSSPSSKYFSISSSSAPAAASMMASRAFSTSPAMLAGMSMVFSVLPSPVKALFSSTQTTPANLPFSMMGSSMGAMWLPYLSVMLARALVKLAFSWSILLTTIMRAEWVLSHIAQAFSAPTSRPDTAPTTISAPSHTVIGPTCSPAKSK